MRNIQVGSLVQVFIFCSFLLSQVKVQTKLFPNIPNQKNIFYFVCGFFSGIFHSEKKAVFFFTFPMGYIWKIFPEFYRFLPFFNKGLVLFSSGPN